MRSAVEEQVSEQKKIHNVAFLDVAWEPFPNDYFFD